MGFWKNKHVVQAELESPALDRFEARRFGRSTCALAVRRPMIVVRVYDDRVLGDQAATGFGKARFCAGLLA